MIRNLLFFLCDIFIENLSRLGLVPNVARLLLKLLLSLKFLWLFLKLAHLSLELLWLTLELLLLELLPSWCRRLLVVAWIDPRWNQLMTGHDAGQQQDLQRHVVHDFES